MKKTTFKLALFIVLAGNVAHAQETVKPPQRDTTLAPMRDLLERFAVDRRILRRSNRVPMSMSQMATLRRYYRLWLDRLALIKFDRLNQEGKIDYLLLRNQLTYLLRKQEISAKNDLATMRLIPFAKVIVDLAEKQRQMTPIHPAKIAKVLNKLSAQIGADQAALAKQLKRGAKPGIDRVTGQRILQRTRDLHRVLYEWNRFYDGYHPEFTWWNKAPYKDVDAALRSFTSFVEKRIVHPDPTDKERLIGVPIGSEALTAELEYEMIPYSPSELIDIATAEFNWCDREMEKASRQLGFGSDWRKAQEHVKNLYVSPGKQPELIRDLALEAIAFLDKRNLVTIPPLCRNTWRMRMMSPARQRVSPYFLGGEVIMISYPTDTMSHRDKMMSMRGNNIHFSRATVQHELIPGHHLQGFMADRYRTHRKQFRTPFLVEGWALYWEMLLWDLKFPRGPEDKIGMLFWRKHRCARIVFSLNYHLGRMTAKECVEYLIRRVGHERKNATAEVRRSIAGAYGPLYQAAYMLGGLQIREMSRELVDTKKMTHKKFHDDILRENSIPVAMIRASLTRQKLTRDFKSKWRFYRK